MFLDKIFGESKLVKELKEELAEAKIELEKRQAAINKTNSYWKGVVKSLKEKRK